MLPLSLHRETRTWQVGAGLWGEAVRGLAAVQLGSVVMGFGVPAFKSYGAHAGLTLNGVLIDNCLLSEYLSLY